MLFANAAGAARTAITATPNPVWLDLLNPTPEERAVAEQVAGFALPTREDIAEIESSSRVSVEHGVLFLNTPISYRDAEGRSAIAPVGFALSEHHLVTIRFANLPVFDKFADHFAGKPECSGAHAFAGLVEALVDHVADVLERLGAELDQLSKQTFHTGGQRRNPRRADSELRQTLTNVGLFEDAVGNLRDTLLGLTRIVAYAQQSGGMVILEGVRQQLQTVRQDIASLNDYDQQLTAKMSFLLDAVLGFISIEQNNSMKVLTVVSVVGIPPTFVVGLYGMNFKNMPEYDWAWGYQWGWLLILLSIVVPLVFFRIKGWL